VRGDSIRDLYAKVLAIAGLGVLAGIGALVDYWPSGNNVPAILAAGVPRPEVPVPTPATVAAAYDINNAAPVAAVAMTRRVRATAQPVALEPVAPTAAHGALPMGHAVALNLPAPVPMPVPVTAAPATAAPAETIALPPPPVVDTVHSAPRVPTFVPTLVSTESESGFVMGTLRRTGAGIARGSAVTGASIIDAFRGVAGAFKKVSPFKDRGFIESN
jgi:hypothetical protein